MQVEERSKNGECAKAFLQRTGGNFNDPKTRAAYDRFKRPLYHLTINNSNKKERKDEH